MKKTISILIIMMLCLSCTIPCFATDTKHSKATLEAEKRGVEIVDNIMVWGDTLTPVENGLMPYAEYYKVDDSSLTDDYIDMIYDYQIAKGLHDKYCDCKVKKTVKKAKKKHCKKHKKFNKKCKKCKKLLTKKK